MIKADSKPLDEVFGFIEDYRRVLVLGCGGCVSVCHVGGDKEVEVLAQSLRLKAKKQDRDMTILENTVRRQCEPEFVDPIIEDLDGADAVVSIACGVGVNHMVDRGCSVPVFPGVDTTFMGSTVEHGVWEERCQGCGRCILHLTGGICPIARCAKTIMNGPCGGTDDGMCEISTEEHPVACGWSLIVERAKELGNLEELMDILEARDWSHARHGGLRRRSRPDLKVEEPEPVESAQGN